MSHTPWEGKKIENGVRKDTLEKCGQRKRADGRGEGQRHSHLEVYNWRARDCLSSLSPYINFCVRCLVWKTRNIQRLISFLFLFLDPSTCARFSIFFLFFFWIKHCTTSLRDINHWFEKQFSNKNGQDPCRLIWQCVRCKIMTIDWNNNFSNRWSDPTNLHIVKLVVQIEWLFFFFKSELDN